MMTAKEALTIVEKQRDDYKATSDNFEAVFPGATSSYHDLIDAYTFAGFALRFMIDLYGEEYTVSGI